MKMKTVFAVVGGGLGTDQTLDIQNALAGLANVQVFSPDGTNDYKASFADAVRISPADVVIIVGHSFSCDSACWCAQQLMALGIAVDLAVFIAPVWQDKHPVNCRKVIWLDPEHSMLPRASVIGVSLLMIKGTDHNSICHAAETINIIVQAVREARDGGEAA